MANKSIQETNSNKILIVKCTPLDDQWECDCDRIPRVIVDKTVAQKSYSGSRYEWYEIKPDGTLHVIKEYNG